MVKRKRIALLFTYNEGWIGGTYYLLNIIHALNSLPDEQKPALTLCVKDKNSVEYIVKETAYPYIDYFFEQRTLGKRIAFNINNIGRTIFKKSIFSKKQTDHLLPNNYDLVFANPRGYYYQLVDNKKKANWIADFQEDYYPQYFDIGDIVARKTYQLEIALTSHKVVFSSNDAKKDFDRLQSIINCKEYVIPFAVTHPLFSHLDIKDIKEKFNITTDYYYAPNQFWAHKNHILIVEAVKKLKQKGKNIIFLFSGKEHDYRNSDYATLLKNTVAEYSLEDNIKFLGFLDRAEQLCIMKHAKAIVQPSHFEGWSTVIEDAKSMNQLILASNLGVHKEQLDCNAMFFDEDSPDELAQSIEKVENGDFTITKFDYNINIKEFALNFLKLAE